MPYSCKLYVRDVVNLIFNFSAPLNRINIDTPLAIVLQASVDTILFANQRSGIFLRRLKDGIEKALSGQLIVDQSIIHNLAEQYYRFLLWDDHFPQEVFDNWAGWRTVIATNAKNSTMFLYQTGEDFTLEIWPARDWTQTIPFDTKLEPLTPVLITIITKDTLKQWLKTINTLIGHIEHNMPMRYVPCEECK